MSSIDLHQIFFMGGYGMYVWPAYAITLFVFGINFFSSFRENRRVKKLIKHKLNSNQVS